MTKAGAIAEAQKGLLASGCNKQTCLHAAAYLTRNLDTSVDPCDNFYQYACGGWTATHEVPPDKTTLTVMDEMKQKAEEKRREVSKHQLYMISLLRAPPAMGRRNLSTVAEKNL